MKALIFDLDGTLWDSSECLYKIWNIVFEKRNIPLRVTHEYVSSLFGKTNREIATIVFPDLPFEEAYSHILAICDEEIVYLNEHGAKIYEGLEETLKTLQENNDLYIVSNCQDGYIESFLKAHHMSSYFKDIECEGRTGKVKAENIQLLMQRNNIKEAYYIGDTQGDQNASKLASIPFIYASYGFGEVNTYDYIINDIRELVDLKL